MQRRTSWSRLLIFWLRASTSACDATVSSLPALAPASTFMLDSRLAVRSWPTVCAQTGVPRAFSDDQWHAVQACYCLAGLGGRSENKKLIVEDPSRYS